MRFNYADGRMPVAMSKNGSTYYLGYDQVGSRRVVSDASGSVVKQIDYDSFGNIISDTAPLFEMPFGFAGGLHDRDTGLVRFGYRDYDPDTGRWTAKDPIRFAGGDTDLYAYCLNSPIMFGDPWGLSTNRPSLYDRISTTVQVVDLVPINSYPHPYTWTVGFVLDVGAAAFAAADIVRAELRGDLTLSQGYRAFGLWVGGVAISGLTYVPGSVGAIYGTAGEAAFLVAQMQNLTGQPNPFAGW